MAAVNCFPKNDGIKGDQRKDEIDLETWCWDETNAGASVAGGGPGEVSMQDTSFTKSIHKATPEFMTRMLKALRAALCCSSRNSRRSRHEAGVPAWVEQLGARQLMSAVNVLAQTATETVPTRVVNHATPQPLQATEVQAESAKPLVKGAITSGIIGQNGEKVTYTFPGKVGEQLELALISTSPNSRFHVKLVVISPSGAQVHMYGRRIQNGSEHKLRRLTEEGTYRVEVQATNRDLTGTYKLGLECIISPNPTRLARGQTARGAINEPIEKDQFTIQGRQGDKLKLVLASTPRDSDSEHFVTLQVYSPTGKPVGSFNYRHSDCIEFNLHTLKETGTYMVQVQAANLHSTGTYTLKLA